MQGKKLIIFLMWAAIFPSWIMFDYFIHSTHNPIGLVAPVFPYSILLVLFLKQEGKTRTDYFWVVLAGVACSIPSLFLGFLAYCWLGNGFGS